MKKTLILITMLMVSVLMFGLTVDGYVTDADTGEAIEGASVRFIPVGTCSGGGGHGGNGGGGNGGGMNIVSAITDQNGYYIITDLVEGTYDALAVKHGSYNCQRIEDIELIENTSIDFELTGGTCIPPARLLINNSSSKR